MDSEQSAPQTILPVTPTRSQLLAVSILLVSVAAWSLLRWNEVRSVKRRARRASQVALALEREEEEERRNGSLLNVAADGGGAGIGTVGAGQGGGSSLLVRRSSSASPSQVQGGGRNTSISPGPVARRKKEKEKNRKKGADTSGGAGSSPIPLPAVAVSPRLRPTTKEIAIQTEDAEADDDFRPLVRDRSGRKANLGGAGTEPRVAQVGEEDRRHDLLENQADGRLDRGRGWHRNDGEGISEQKGTPVRGSGSSTPFSLDDNTAVYRQANVRDSRTGSTSTTGTTSSSTSTALEHSSETQRIDTPDTSPSPAPSLPLSSSATNDTPLASRPSNLSILVPGPRSESPHEMADADPVGSPSHSPSTGVKYGWPSSVGNSGSTIHGVLPLVNGRMGRPSINGLIARRVSMQSLNGESPVDGENPDVGRDLRVFGLAMDKSANSSRSRDSLSGRGGSSHSSSSGPSKMTSLPSQSNGGSGMASDYLEMRMPKAKNSFKGKRKEEDPYWTLDPARQEEDSWSVNGTGREGSDDKANGQGRSSSKALQQQQQQQQQQPDQSQKAESIDPRHSWQNNGAQSNGRLGISSRNPSERDLALAASIAANQGLRRISSSALLSPKAINDQIGSPPLSPLAPRSPYYYSGSGSHGGGNPYFQGQIPQHVIQPISFDSSQNQQQRQQQQYQWIVNPALLTSPPAAYPHQHQSMPHTPNGTASISRSGSNSHLNLMVSQGQSYRYVSAPPSPFVDASQGGMQPQSYMGHMQAVSMNLNGSGPTMQNVPRISNVHSPPPQLQHPLNQLNMGHLAKGHPLSSSPRASSFSSAPPLQQKRSVSPRLAGLTPSASPNPKSPPFPNTNAANGGGVNNASGPKSDIWKMKEQIGMMRTKLKKSEIQTEKCEKELEIARWRLDMVELERLENEAENKKFLMHFANRAERAEAKVKLLEARLAALVPAASTSSQPGPSIEPAAGAGVPSTSSLQQEDSTLDSQAVSCISPIDDKALEPRIADFDPPLPFPTFTPYATIPAFGRTHTESTLLLSPTANRRNRRVRRKEATTDRVRPERTPRRSRAEVEDERNRLSTGENEDDDLMVFLESPVLRRSRSSIPGRSPTNRDLALRQGSRSEERHAVGLGFDLDGSNRGEDDDAVWDEAEDLLRGVEGVGVLPSLVGIISPGRANSEGSRRELRDPEPLVPIVSSTDFAAPASSLAAMDVGHTIEDTGQHEEPLPSAVVDVQAEPILA